MFEGAKSRLGQQMGNYRLTGWLGQGGFADVYLGEHIYLKTQCALKLLHLQLSEDTFLNEARTIAGLEHPNIVRVFDYGVDNKLPYLVMSYAPNGSLRKRFPKGTRVEQEQVVIIVQQVAAALDYAHQQKLIHRDVKPENMLAGQNDQVLLSDFGLVLVAQSTSSQTVNSLAGTIPYMAPEQLQGRVHFASDQYALGIVTYEWLCGGRPFTGAFSEIAGQHLLATPPSLCARVPGLPFEVEQAVFKALAKDPAQRYESVMAFANALQDACKQPASIYSSTFVPARPAQVPLPPDAVARSNQHDVQLAVVTPDPAGKSRSDLPEQSTVVLAPQKSSHPLQDPAQPAATTPLPGMPTPTQPSRADQSAVAAINRALRRPGLLLVALLVVIAGSLGTWYGLGYLTGPELRQISLPFIVQQSPAAATAGNTTATASAKATATAGKGTPVSTPSTPGVSTTPMSTATSTSTSTPTPTATAVPDCIQGSPASLTFTTPALAPQVVTLTNCGGSTGWSSSVHTNNGGNWLSLSPSSGNIDPNHNKAVSVSIAILTLPVGTYHGTITFTKGSATWVLTVDYIILA